MSRNPGTSNTGSSASGAFGYTYTGTFSSAPLQSATGSSPFGGGNGCESAHGGTPAAGTSGTNVFGSTACTGSVFGCGGSLFGQPEVSGFAKAITPLPVTTGTSTPAYSGFFEKDPSNPRTILHYKSITAAPAYMGTSLEELRVQDYQQNRKTDGASGQTSSGAPSLQISSFFVTPTTTQQPRTASGSIFGCNATGAFGTIISQPAMLPFGAIWPGTGTSIPGSASAFGQTKHATEFGSIFRQSTDPILDPSKMECIAELLRKFVLGEELVNTQFHLFSARSSASGQVMKPRALCANNVLLATSSKYFVDLLSSDINPSDLSLVDLMGDNDIPSNAHIDDYGYGSDSDLEECDDLIPVADPEAPKGQSAASSTSPSETSAETRPKDGNELFENGFGSVGSGVYPEQPRMGESSSANKDGARPVASSETAVQETVGNKRLGNQTAMRLRSLGSRHVLVKDTAFQTWYSLLNYLFTGRFRFLPLSSAAPGGHHEFSMSSSDEPKCSAKSMYRLACKVGLDQLRDEAFSYIQSNLSEHNILKELSCSLVSRHLQLLEMELDVLYSHIASPPVAVNFAALVQRTIDKEIPHGGDVIVGIYTRLLRERHVLSLKPVSPTPLPSFSGPRTQAELALGASEAPEGGVKHETGPSYVDKRGVHSGFLPSESGVAPLNVPPRTAAGMEMPTATSTKEPEAGGKGKKKATGKRK